MFKLFPILAMAAFLAVTIMPQSAQSQTTAQQQTSQKQTNQKQNWRAEFGTMRIGMIKSHLTDPSPTAQTRIADDFSEILNMPVEVIFTRDFPTLIEGQMAGRIDYAIYSASAYATAHLLCKCVIPLVAPIAENGAEGLRVFLFSQSQNLRKVNDMPSSRIGWMQGDTVTSALLPKAGISILGKPFLGTEPFIAIMEDEAQAVTALNEATLDGVFAWGQGNSTDRSAETNAKDRLVALGLENTDIRPIWQSDFLRFGPHAVIQRVPLEARNELTKALTAMRNTNPVLYELLDETLGGGFQSVAETEYIPVISMVNKLSAAK